MRNGAKRWVPPYAWLLLLVILLALATAGGIFVFRSYERRADSYDLREVAAIPQRSVVYDREGTPIAWLHGENRFLVPLHRVPLFFLLALMAREDSRFQEHDGIDISGIARAMAANLREGRIRQGGSTITQQLARNTFHLRARTLDRKLTEAFLARRIERSFPKRKILEYYLNRIYFGERCYGLQQAARFYFGKPASALTLGECATIVGLIRSPNRSSPFASLAAAMEQRNLVLARMQELGMITPEQSIAARNAALELSGRRDQPHHEGYVLDAVRRDLNTLLTPRQQRLGGYRITITIDQRLQKKAEKALQRRTAELEKSRRWKHPRRSADAGEEKKATDYLQAALVAIENDTGAIRALVGGRDYKQSKYDRACLARRQVGSTFKPFVYASAFERGLLPGDPVSDGPISPEEFGPHFPKKWNPQNADGQYGGVFPASSGLIRSRNTMSIRVGERTGVEALLEKVGQLGLSRLPPYPAIYLGGFEATLRELTSAFTVFPNSGEWQPAHLIERIEDASGRTVYQAPLRSRRVFNTPAAEMTSDLMEAVVQNGTARRARGLGLRKIAAGKTGTSNDCKDAWFVGYTRSITCGVWVGFDQPKEIMKGGYGSVLALPIWVDFMQHLSEKNYPTGLLCQRSPREAVAVCNQSGQRAHIGCQQAGTVTSASMPFGMSPTRSCPLHLYQDEYDPESEAAVAEAWDAPPEPPPTPPPRRSFRQRPPQYWSDPPRTMRSRRSRPVLRDGDVLYRTRNGPVIIRRYHGPSPDDYESVPHGW